MEGTFSWSVALGSWTVPTWLWAVVGFVLLPWVTVALVFTSPGGIVGFDWAIIVIALLVDLGALGSGREARRRRT